jgi:hypothetical protein
MLRFCLLCVKEICVNKTELIMATTTFHQSIPATYTHVASTPSAFSRFINWSERQQENRILWIGLALVVHGCILAPLSVWIISMTGNSLALFMTAMASMCAALVVNLAAMPTKITIPVFFATLLIDVAVIAAAASMMA